jgi:hypothetical protein
VDEGARGCGGMEETEGKKVKREQDGAGNCDPVSSANISNIRILARRGPCYTRATKGENGLEAVKCLPEGLTHHRGGDALDGDGTCEGRRKADPGKPEHAM